MLDGQASFPLLTVEKPVAMLLVYISGTLSVVIKTYVPRKDSSQSSRTAEATYMRVATEDIPLTMNPLSRE